MPPLDIPDLLQRDLSEVFIHDLRDALRAEYARTFETLSSPPAGFEAVRPSIEFDDVDLRAARKARRENGMRALTSVCRNQGVPLQRITLRCNGQLIVAGQIGQLILLTEPIDCLTSRPEHAKYKEDLAASHFAIRQLEMDLGDGWRQRIDARNTMLVLVQHGMRVGGFNRRDTALSMMRVVVPNASFDSWLFRADALNGELGGLLDWSSFERDSIAKPKIEDRVIVRLKNNVAQNETD